MTIWSILTLLCDALKLTQAASYLWGKHERHEAQAVSDTDDKLGDSAIVARLRAKYGRVS